MLFQATLYPHPPLTPVLRILLWPSDGYQHSETAKTSTLYNPTLQLTRTCVCSNPEAKNLTIAICVSPV